MTQLYAPVVICTAATVLAVVLLALRANFQGQRRVMALAQQWVETGTITSGLVLGLLCAVAGYSFVLIPSNVGYGPGSASALNISASTQSTQGATPLAGDAPGDGQAWDALRAYAEEIGPKLQAAAATPAASDAVALPEVDTMIAKLVARLESQPDDVKGWKMLAWSYLNTDRPQDAARAYETALKLDPGDTETTKGLEAAKLAMTGSTAAAPSRADASPNPQDVKTTEGQSDSERDTMIRGMVDKLAARLENSPNDEDGWMRLMRSRVVMGDKDAAKAALTKALQSFDNDAAAQARLAAAAREFGVDGP